MYYHQHHASVKAKTSGDHEKMKTFKEPMTPRLKTQKPKTTKNWTAGT